jgi:uncharacterized membrane protein HdeD (DUF308 family)
MVSMTVESAAEVLRESMREAVRRHSAWYLLQSVLMVLAGVLALVFPALSSVALVFYLGWILIFAGVIQAISLIDAHHVSHFWIQLISAALFVVVGLLFLRNPTAGAVSLTLLLNNPCLDDPPVPELGLGPAQWHRGDCALVVPPDPYS